ncbi:MAG: polymer-forming cytoskeletal protein [Candidatus Algichlamydia australiensis]|nr:polymer-forming cytoskeletal protein [Chlamydiales bacterium]
MRRLFLLFFIPLLLFAQDEQEIDDSIIIVPRDQVINDDYYAWGGTIEIAGVINGDLYVTGSQIFIDGTVNGDVLVAGGSVNISGQVVGDLRLLSGQTLITGSIGRSATLVSGNVEMTSPASIGRNLSALCGNMDLAGRLEGNGHIYSSSLRLSDRVGGNIAAYVGRMRATSTTNIQGKLEYWSDQLALISPGATIQGGLLHHPSFIYTLSQHPWLKWLQIGSKLATLLMNFFYSLILGFIFMRYFQHRLDRAFSAMERKPLQSLITGALVLIVLPLISLLLLMTILGVPFALTLLAINVIGFYTGKIFTMLFVTRWGLGKLHKEKWRKIGYMLTLIGYFFLTMIPYFGQALVFAVTLFGLGAIVTGRADLAKSQM